MSNRRNLYHIEHIQGADPVVFQWKNTYYLFCTKDGNLSIYYSDDPTSQSWYEHPFQHSIENCPNRMAGRPISTGNSLYLMFQDGMHYGERVRCFEVTELNKTTFKQREILNSPILHGQYTQDWNHLGMHHIDFNWEDGYAIVDGHNKSGWKIGIVELNTGSPPPPKITSSPEQFVLRQHLLRKREKYNNRTPIYKRAYDYWQEYGTFKLINKVKNKMINKD